MFFSKLPLLYPSSGQRHVPIARIPTLTAWHMVQHRLVLYNYYWMCLVYLCFQDAPLRTWRVLQVTQFVFSRGPYNPV